MTRRVKGGAVLALCGGQADQPRDIGELVGHTQLEPSAFRQELSRAGKGGGLWGEKASWVSEQPAVCPSTSPSA